MALATGCVKSLFGWILRTTIVLPRVQAMRSQQKGGGGFSNDEFDIYYNQLHKIYLHLDILPLSAFRFGFNIDLWLLNIVFLPPSLALKGQPAHPLSH